MAPENHRAAETGPNPNTPEKAEEARQDRPRVQQDEGTVQVRALVPVSTPDGEPHYRGQVFTVRKESVEQALARGLVEPVKEAKATVKAPEPEPAQPAKRQATEPKATEAKAKK